MTMRPRRSTRPGARGIRYFDTAPLYGYGAAERRLGRALRNAAPRRVRARDQGRARVATRRRRTGGDHLHRCRRPRAALRLLARRGACGRSRTASTRLGTDRIDVAFVHDPDNHEDDALRSAFPTSLRLRDEGVVGAVGCGMNQTAMLERFVARVDVDCVLLAGRYSLLDRSGAELLAQCAHAVWASCSAGCSTPACSSTPTPTRRTTTRPRRPACSSGPATPRRVQERGVALGAAALQFAMRHPAVTTVLVGARAAAEVELDVAFRRDADHRRRTRSARSRRSSNGQTGAGVCGIAEPPERELQPAEHQRDQQQLPERELGEQHEGQAR